MGDLCVSFIRFTWLNPKKYFYKRNSEKEESKRKGVVSVGEIAQTIPNKINTYKGIL